MRDSRERSWENPRAIQIQVLSVSASAAQSLWSLSLTTSEPTVPWVSDKG